MQTNSFLNNLNAKATVAPIFGPIRLLQKSMDALFLSYFQVVIETAASLPEKLKGRPIIIIYEANGLINRLLGDVHSQIERAFV